MEENGEENDDKSEELTGMQITNQDWEDVRKESVVAALVKSKLTASSTLPRSLNTEQLKTAIGISAAETRQDTNQERHGSDASPILQGSASGGAKAKRG